MDRGERVERGLELLVHAVVQVSVRRRGREAAGRDDQRRRGRRGTARPPASGRRARRRRATARSGSTSGRTSRSSTSATTWHQPDDRAAPPPNTTSSIRCPLNASTTGSSQRRLWAVPSTIARTTSARTVSNDRLRNPARVERLALGDREPLSHGRNSTPAPPAATRPGPPPTRRTRPPAPVRARARRPCPRSRSRPTPGRCPARATASTAPRGRGRRPCPPWCRAAPRSSRSTTRPAPVRTRRSRTHRRGCRSSARGRRPTRAGRAETATSGNNGPTGSSSGASGGSRDGSTSVRRSSSGSYAVTPRDRLSHTCAMNIVHWLATHRPVSRRFTKSIGSRYAAVPACTSGRSIWKWRMWASDSPPPTGGMPCRSRNTSNASGWRPMISHEWSRAPLVEVHHQRSSHRARRRHRHDRRVLAAHSHRHHVGRRVRRRRRGRRDRRHDGVPQRVGVLLGDVAVPARRQRLPTGRGQVPVRADRARS